MSSDRSDHRAHVEGVVEESTEELPVLVAAEPAQPVMSAVVTGRAAVGWPHSIPFGSPNDATVPIAIPANLLGDVPVARPSVLMTVAVHAMFLLIAIVLVSVLMVIAAR
jgi:hypothetical protein